MADNTLDVRIQLRYGTYSQWMTNNTVLMRGEAAICAFPLDYTIESLSNSEPEYTPPAIGIKIGDGTHTFKQLPWVQAISADVYDWAKSAYKPTYTYGEIQGLQDYITGLLPATSEDAIEPRIYQFIQGTGANANKYYLRYKETTESNNWVTDTDSYIDLSNLNTIINWIGISSLNQYNDLDEEIESYISTINSSDTAVANQFVTEVSQTGGTISVSRAQPSFSNISGTATVAQGGTGLSSLTANSVLVGNGTNPVQLIPIATEINNNNYLVPSSVVKSYVDGAISNLSGAMQFIGIATEPIVNGSTANPVINGYNFSNVHAGDVILYDSAEFIWADDAWRLLGDESSYAIKGSIVNADISTSAAIAQSKIAGLTASLAGKVDVEEGKVLTSNDFTDTFMNKLTGIATGAQVNTIEAVVYNSTTITPVNKVINITPDPHTEHENKIEQIFINGVEWVPNEQKQVRILLNQSDLNLNVLEGATIPDGAGSTTSVPQSSKNLLLERIAMTGDVMDLRQTANTYIILDCGTSDSESHPTISNS